MQHLCKMTRLFMFCCYRDLLFKTNAFFTYLFYFISLSCLGFGFLKALKPRTESYTPTNIDLFYTSVSAVTVSSMSAVEMEVFSNAQLIVITALMFLGGEVFTSMARLHLNAYKSTSTAEEKAESRPPHNISFDQIELSIVAVPHHSLRNSNNSVLKYDSIKFLGLVVLGYLLVVQILGIVGVFLYLALVSSAGNVVRNKGIKVSTFVVFTVVSTFSNCGFVPTNENMIVFSNNSGLLLILIPLILLGNTLFPCGLRVVIWVLGRKFNKVEAEYLLKQTGIFQHLLPALHSMLLAATVLGFLLIGFVLFSSLEWNTAGLDGLNTYQKVVGIIFQCTNARHSGETIVDLSTISPAILVFFVFMMLVSLPLALSLTCSCISLLQCHVLKTFI